MNRLMVVVAALLGAAAIGWIGQGFRVGHASALGITALIGGVYLIGLVEMWQFRRATGTLSRALAGPAAAPAGLESWLAVVDPTLQGVVRVRLEGSRAAMPAPALTPYLVGMLVMLGMLGTFVGMVVTLNGAVLALDGSTDLQAMRVGLSAPIKGLGLSFGTSVAGVAASTMLGLIATLSRRDREQLSGLLDRAIGSHLQGFSAAYQRDETFRALRTQSQGLPAVIAKLDTMASSLGQMTTHITETLVGNQARFQDSVQAAFSELARSVGQSLNDSLSASGRLAGESIKPLVEATLATLASENQRLHGTLTALASEHLGAVSSTLNDASSAWVNKVVADWRETGEQLLARWETAGDANLTRQQVICTAVEQTAAGVAEQVQAANGRLADTVGQWLASTRGFIDARQQAEAAWITAEEARSRALTDMREQSETRWLQAQEARIREVTQAQIDSLQSLSQVQAERLEGLATSQVERFNGLAASQAERLDALVHALREELGALRADEQTRAQAVLDHWSVLQATMAEQLATLGSTLEAPMARLMETASEAPRAAAEVLVQLRQELSQSLARDNGLLEERARLMNEITALLEGWSTAASGQQAAVAALVQGSEGLLRDLGARVADEVRQESAALVEAGSGIVSSAVEVAGLSESLNTAVNLFGEANLKLVEQLARIEASLEKATARSDEQLGYYVAQAREIIDLTLLSQKEVLETLRQVSAPAAAEVG